MHASKPPKDPLSTDTSSSSNKLVQSRSVGEPQLSAVLPQVFASVTRLPSIDVLLEEARSPFDQDEHYPELESKPIKGEALPISPLHTQPSWSPLPFKSHPPQTNKAAPRPYLPSQGVIAQSSKVKADLPTHSVSTKRFV